MITEQRNQASEHIDTLSGVEIARLMNSEDAQVAAAIGRITSEIGSAIEMIAETFRHGGRLIYVGAGTSGRLGVLDASECPPTFNTSPEMVVGLIAGGPAALTRAIEGAEDDPELAVRDLQEIALSDKDTVVGIASSGRTPYVIGGLKLARQSRAKTIGVTCNTHSQLDGNCDLLLCAVVGPEVISGSTRLKAGTATKMMLNMLTTGAMALIGKTYGNLMVDLRASNSKLRARSERIVTELTGLAREEAAEHLRRCDGELKTTVVSILLGVDAVTARERLQATEGRLREALHGK